MIGLRLGRGGVWREEFPGVRPTQRRVLLEVARGDSLVLEERSGAIRLRRQGAVVHARVLAALVRQAG